ncbi:hypothetical protein Mesil_0045 [Allomeiothermus silvanus DSM 9946]|uniref:Uncharacterized protein n=1 Tax=Allomeiothermus silvanus (strain ATCC 700542 / DSM 9946 / NBRC 106475 / NCIMB 13440 / VI-R2) TaxID=526227 RepID=D7BG72_ALLS1|nr:hypothetical protein [Allomeiothermus silvanus]ADH61993.1 hypothetical protein Mesil_0045 [Allomeiothermus silvanus DSM 9946]
MNVSRQEGRESVLEFRYLIATPQGVEYFTGVRYLRTNNHSVNRPMLAINEAMGFVKEPAFVTLIQEISQ